jgi:hypothetical protein
LINVINYIRYQPEWDHHPETSSLLLAVVSRAIELSIHKLDPKKGLGQLFGLEDVVDGVPKIGNEALQRLARVMNPSHSKRIFFRLSSMIEEEKRWADCPGISKVIDQIVINLDEGEEFDRTKGVVAAMLLRGLRADTWSKLKRVEIWQRALAEHNRKKRIQMIEQAPDEDSAEKNDKGKKSVELGELLPVSNAKIRDVSNAEVEKILDGLKAGSPEQLSAVEKLIEKKNPYYDFAVAFRLRDFEAENITDPERMLGLASLLVDRIASGFYQSGEFGNTRNGDFGYEIGMDVLGILNSKSFAELASSPQFDAVMTKLIGTGQVAKRLAAYVGNRKSAMGLGTLSAHPHTYKWFAQALVVPFGIGNGDHERADIAEHAIQAMDSDPEAHLNSDAIHLLKLVALDESKYVFLSHKEIIPMLARHPEWRSVPGIDEVVDRCIVRGNYEPWDLDSFQAKNALEIADDDPILELAFRLKGNPVPMAAQGGWKDHPRMAAWLKAARLKTPAEREAALAMSDCNGLLTGNAVPGQN